jgi:phosphatidylserine/phosphatidylglycerophosphate/cardiolipin synthase-like enzyme
MRFRNTTNNFRLYAVTGTNTVAFAIDCDEAEMTDLLGFMVEKEYDKADGTHVRVTVMGFKVFKERIEDPVPGALYSTWDNPIQSFTWEDFTAYPGCDYTYHFTPLYDSPLNIRRGPAVSIVVKTELAWKENDHSIFFNRGVAASQAYALKFGNVDPDQVPDGKAYKWLSRGLKEAILAFIGKAQPGDAVHTCFYEFRYDEVLTALKTAAGAGVSLHIIYDAKANGKGATATKPAVKSFPRDDNEEAITNAGLDEEDHIELIPRKMNKSYICHNKFMVLVKNGVPKMVWTGSTNISKGGIFGQSNVGHAVEDSGVAGKFLAYWNVLKDDPGGTVLKAANEQIQATIASVNALPLGMTCIFSPRKDLDMLRFYADLLDSATDCACITLAFGVHTYFEQALADNDTRDQLTFLLLEKDDPDISDYVYKHNIVKAVGSNISDDSIFKWVKETNTNLLNLNTHVMYVHTKFLLRDPLSEHPVVVTGSANFSEAATDTNDENMIIIHGNRRVADIYFTEFMRLFNHYYFRWVVRKMQEKGTLDPENPAFLKSASAEWTGQYKQGKLKRKKVEVFVRMFVEEE